MLERNPYKFKRAADFMSDFKSADEVDVNKLLSVLEVIADESNLAAEALQNIYISARESEQAMVERYELDQSYDIAA